MTVNPVPTVPLWPLALLVSLWQTDFMDTTLPKKRERLSPQQRREQLMQAAVTAYAQQGVERAGHGDIAKLTSASTATVFNYFPTRGALTDAVLDYVSARILAAMEIENAKEQDAVSVLSELLSGFNNLIETDPDVVKVILNWSVSFGPAVRPSYLAYQDRVLTKLHSALGRTRTGQTSERSEARLIYAAAISYATMKLDKSPEGVVSEYVKRVFGIFK